MGKKSSVTERLRAEFKKCGESRYALSKRSGIAESVLSRFASGQELSFANIDRLADALGLELVKRENER
jgi:transcriptional regulator with XRE-family HTH domain